MLTNSSSSFSSSSISSSSSAILASTSTTEAKVDKVSKSKLLPKPEYFGIDDPFDTYRFLYMKQRLWNHLFNYEVFHETVEDLITDKLLTHLEKIRLLATSVVSNPKPIWDAIGLSVFLQLFMGYEYDEIESSSLAKKYAKTIEHCLSFLLQQLERYPHFSPNIYALLQTRIVENGIRTLSYRIFINKLFLPYFLAILAKLNISKHEYLTLLGIESNGYEASMLISLSFSGRSLPQNESLPALQQYFEFLFSLIRAQIFSAEDILELLAHRRHYDWLNLYLTLVPNYEYSPNVQFFIQQLLKLISLLPTNTPAELVRMYFNTCLAFTFSSGIYRDIFTSKLLSPAYKNLLLTNNKLLSDIATSQVTPASATEKSQRFTRAASSTSYQSYLQQDTLDYELKKMLAQLQQEKDSTTENYKLLRQDIYEQLAAMIASERILLTSTSQTIPLVMALLTSLCQGLTPECSSRYLFLILTQIYSRHYLMAPLQLCLPNNILVKPKSYLVPEKELQLIAGLQDLHKNNHLDSHHIFQLFCYAAPAFTAGNNSQINFFSYTTTSQTEKFLDEIFDELLQAGFAANYLFRIYQITNGHQQNVLKVRLAAITARSSTDATIDVTLINRWLTQGIAPSSIFALLAQKDTLPKINYAAFNIYEDRRLQQINQMGEISVIHSLIDNDSNITILISCLKALIKAGLPANTIVHYLVQPYDESSNSPSILTKIIAGLRCYSDEISYNHNYLKEITYLSMQSLLEFFAEIDHVVLEKNDFYFHLNQALEAFYDEDEEGEKFYSAMKIGTVIWYACSCGITNIDIKYSKLFLKYILIDNSNNQEKLLDTLLACLDPNTHLGAYFLHEEPTLDSGILKIIVEELRHLDGSRSSNSTSATNLAAKNQKNNSASSVKQFLALLLAKRQISLGTILCSINPVPILSITPILHNFDPSKVLTIRYSSNTKQLYLVTPTTAATITPSPSLSFNSGSTTSLSSAVATSLSPLATSDNFDYCFYPAHLVENDAQFKHNLIELVTAVNRINSIVWAQLFINALKDHGFFKYTFDRFYLGKLSPEAMESLFMFLGQMETCFRANNFLTENALDDFLQPHLKKNNIDHAQKSGFLLWLKAKYQLLSAPYDGIDFKGTLSFFICLNFRDVQTQAQIYFACLDYNSTLGRLIHQPYHYILAEFSLTKKPCSTSIQKGALFECFKRLCYLHYLAMHGISCANVITPEIILDFEAATATTATASVSQEQKRSFALQTFSPVFDRKTFTTLLDAAEKKYHWTTKEQIQRILAFCNSNLPVEWKMIAETTKASIKKSLFPNASCCTGELSTEEKLGQTATAQSAVVAVSTSSSSSASAQALPVIGLFSHPLPEAATRAVVSEPSAFDQMPALQNIPSTYNTIL